MLLDQRVRRAGSHHQKMVVLRTPHPGARRRVRRRHRPVPHPPRRRRPPRRPAGRADGEGVRRAPALARRPARAARPGRRRCSTACSASAGTTRARSTPTTRSSVAARTGSATPTSPPTRCPPQPPDPPAVGPCAVQVLRTYPAIRPRTPYAPARRAVGGPRVPQGAAPGAPADVPRGPVHVVAAHRASCSPTRCAPNPELHLIVVVPRHPDVDGRFALPPNEVGRLEAIAGRAAGRAGPGARVRPGEPRTARRSTCTRRSCVIDDVWACVGSANLNRRSWSHDSELSCAVLDDDARRRASRADPAGLGDGARALRPRPAAGRCCASTSTAPPGDDADLLDPDDAVAAVTRGRRRARRAGTRGGRVGPRPPGTAAPAPAPRRMRAVDAALGRAASTGSSTTRTGASVGCPTGGAGVW